MTSRTVRRRLDGFDRRLSACRRTWDVPGVAVGVVADDDVVFAGGTGTRRLGHDLPVSADTAFAICSCTKAFTTAVLSMLAEEGTLQWERPVRDVWPEFELFDRVVGDRVTARDLVTHRCGLPRHDYVWYGSPATRQQLIEAMKHLEPTADLRTTFQYQNLAYMAAGALAGRLAGCSWEDLVQQRLLDPLGMKATSLDITGLQQAPNTTMPHESRRGIMREVPYRTLDAVAPAGSINSTIDDMTRWLRLQLGQGRFEGSRLFSAASSRDMLRPHTSMGDGGDQAEFQLMSYGLGWTVFAYRGHRVATHSGGIDGYRCRTSLLPDEGIGTVVLTNGDTEMPHALTWELFDTVLGLEPAPWTRRIKAQAKREDALSKRKRRRQLAGRRKGTRLSRPIKGYVGAYQHAGYGRLTIERKRRRWVATLNDIAGHLTHFHYDIFEFHSPRWTRPYLLSFATGDDGGVPSLSVPLEEGVADIVFTRVETSA